jgi:hypothetical protein
MQITLRPKSDFLPVAAVHGGAHLALFEQRLWDSYQLNMLTGGKFVRNSLIIESPGVSPRDDLQNPNGFYGPMNNADSHESQALITPKRS